MLLYRPRHSTLFAPARSSRALLAAVVTLELISGGAAAGGLVSSASGPPAPPGLVQVSPARVAAGARVKLSFTIRAGKEGVSQGRAAIAVPEGWSPPSTLASDPGQVTSTRGDVKVTGRSIEVTGIRLFPSESVTISFGGGSGGATEPTEMGQYKFAASVASSRGLWSGPGPQYSLVSVVAPPYSCQSLSAPSGVGQGLPLENGVVQPNLYNAYSSTGVLKQCSGASGVTTYFSLDSLKPVSYGPAGYPEVAYGSNLDDQTFCTGCPTAPFPLPVADVFRGTHSVSLSISYSLAEAKPADLPRDFLYDVWLEGSARPGSPPGQADVEMLIFLYQQGIAQCSATGDPFAFSTQVIRNGTPALSHWNVCQISGGTKAKPVAFFLQQPSQSANAQLTLSLGDFVRAAGTYLNRNVSDLSVMGIEVGGEFNQCSTNGGCVDPQAEWGWNVQDLTIGDGERTIPVVFREPRSGHR